MRTLALLLAAALGWAGLAPAQEPAVACRFCSSRGERDCNKHRKDVLALEAAVEQCSVAAQCGKCAGALTTDCRICANPAAEAAAAGRRAAAAAWLAGRREAVERHTSGRDILHARSRHCDLTFSIRPLTVGRVKLDSHRLMHLYLERLEALRAEFMRVLGLSERDFSARLEVFIFDDCADHHAIAPRVAGGGGRGTGMKLMGASAVYSMCHDRRAMPGDEGVHRAVVHNVTHLLISNMKPEVWLGNRKHGWIDAGTAHWFEDLITGKCTNFCYEEVGVSGGFKGGEWRVPVRQLVEAGKLEPFTAVAQRNTDQLSGQEHAQVFAYVDFIISSHGGPAFADLVRRIKKGEATRDALPAALGLGILSFDEAFAKWVKATYPLQKR